MCQKKNGRDAMWYGIYDRLLYALAFLEFKRGYVPVDGFHPTERYGRMRLAMARGTFRRG